jgi:FlaA1/EpsC-like NDP-sugar epimerase
MSQWANRDDWEDFLGRPVLQRDASEFASVCKGKTILLTGAGGSIGSSLAKAVVQAGPRLVILLDISSRDLQRLHAELSALQDHTECLSVPGDVCDPQLLNDLFGRYHPEIVFHAAALKHVPLLERHPLAAIRTNTLGTYRVAEAAVRHQAARLVFISTDKVVSPVSILGASKRLGEMVILALDTPKTRMNCVRFGNVLGSRGSVGPIFEEQIRRKGPLTVTHPDVSRYFLTGPEAVLLTLAAASFEDGGRVLVPRLGDPIKVVELAKYLICEAGLIPGKDIEITFTELRPGGKMAEALIAPFETSEPAIAGLLDRVATPNVSRAELGSCMTDLDACLESNDAEALVIRVCQMIREYRPSMELLKFLKIGRAHVHPV